MNLISREELAEMSDDTYDEGAAVSSKHMFFKVKARSISLGARAHG